MKTTRSVMYYYLGSLLSVISLLMFTLYFMFTVLRIGDVGIGKLFGNQIVLVFIAATIIIIPVAEVIYFKRKHQQDVLDRINRSVLMYVVAFLMVFYGYSKMYGKFFEITYLTQDSKLTDVSSFSLAWYFYGRSNVQEFMIGLLEFVPALMLLFRRTRFLGLVVIFPVAANVLEVNIFNRVSGLTFPVSIIIASADVYLLYYYKEKIMTFLGNVEDSRNERLTGFLKIAGLVFKVLVTCTIAFIIVAPWVAKLFAGKPNYEQRNKFTGGFELQSLMVNNQSVRPDTGDARYYKNIYLEPQSRWNTVLTFATTFHPTGIVVKWNRDNDSVHTFLKLDNDVTKDAVSPASEFTGTYKLEGNKLLINGSQYGNTILAVYIRKPLKDYNWFW